MTLPALHYADNAGVAIGYRTAGEGQDVPLEFEPPLPQLEPSATTEPAATRPADLTTPNPHGCQGAPTVELVSNARRLTTDLVFYGEQTPTCGYDRDGGAMFNDTFRPATALLVPDRELMIVTDRTGEVSVDIRALAPGMRLADIVPPPDVLTAAADGTFPIALPARGCFVVTLGIRPEIGVGRFVGLVETERGACQAA